MRKPILRVYADTSVFAGVFDPEFQSGSRLFFERVTSGDLHLAISASVEEELLPAPDHVRGFYEQMLDFAELAIVTPEARALQGAYLEHAVVTAKYATDGLHVAVATVSHCAAIVSWNFRHIVSFRRIPLYNAVNAANGYNPIAIHTPPEVLEYEEGQDC